MNFLTNDAEQVDSLVHCSSDKSFLTLFSYLMVRRVEVHIGQSVGGLVVGGKPGQAQV